MPQKLAKNKPVSYFNATSFGLCDAEFESAEPDQITKRALIMVEGSHIDSAKRPHLFSADRIQKIVDRTNDWIARGGRVPWQMDHKKTQDANIGDLEGGLEVKVITREDLPDQRLNHLIGKVGAFAERLVAKGSDFVDAVYSGRIKTLSPGIDVREDIIREISATPTPAIMGLSTFALTMDEAEQQDSQNDQAQEQFEDLGETFWTVVNSIFTASEDELQGQDPQQLLMQAVSDYASRVMALIGLDQSGDPDQDPSQQMNPQQGASPSGMPQGTVMPNYLAQQQEIGPKNMARMNRRKDVLAAFTMTEMEKLDRAEFLFGIGEQPEKQKGSLLGTAAKVGGLALGGAAALRYGGAGIRSGLKAAVKAGDKAIASGAESGVKRQMAGAFIKKGTRKALKTIGSDISNLPSSISKSTSRIGKEVSSGFAGTRKAVGKWSGGTGIAKKASTAAGNKAPYSISW